MAEYKTIKALLDFVVDTDNGFYGDRVKFNVPAHMADPRLYANEFLEILLEYANYTYDDSVTIYELTVTTQWSRNVKDKTSAILVEGNKVNRELFSTE